MSSSTNAVLVVQYKILLVSFVFLGIFVHTGVTDYNSRERSIAISLQVFNNGSHMNRKNRSSLVYAPGIHSKAGIVRTMLFQKRGSLKRHWLEGKLGSPQL